MYHTIIDSQVYVCVCLSVFDFRDVVVGGEAGTCTRSNRMVPILYRLAFMP
jgi:hypothetical protein